MPRLEQAQWESEGAPARGMDADQSRPPCALPSALRRARMLELINDLPTVYEMVSGKLEREQQSRASKVQHAERRFFPLAPRRAQRLACICPSRSFPQRTRVDDEEGNAEGEPCPITHRPYK